MPRGGRNSLRNATRAVTTTTESKTKQNDKSGFGLNRFKRLSDAASYGRVFKRAHRSRDRWFTVLARANDGEVARRGVARLGLAVSKKHCRLAVSRNRIKRLVRESFRLHQDSLRGLDLVVLNQPGAERAGNRELLHSLERHWANCRSKAGAARVEE